MRRVYWGRAVVDVDYVVVGVAAVVVAVVVGVGRQE